MNIYDFEMELNRKAKKLERWHNIIDLACEVIFGVMVGLVLMCLFVLVFCI